LTPVSRKCSVKDIVNRDCAEQTTNLIGYSDGHHVVRGKTLGNFAFWCGC
jgi:hypothetical protein